MISEIISGVPRLDGESCRARDRWGLSADAITMLIPTPTPKRSDLVP
jgi:hypothetical protein